MFSFTDIYWVLFYSFDVASYYWLLLTTGSGGNNHALEHFQQTHYPLCVKLGTITPDGAGIYSVSCDLT